MIGGTFRWLWKYIGPNFSAVTVRLDVGDFSKNPHVNGILESVSVWVKRKLKTGDTLTSQGQAELAELREILRDIQSEVQASKDILSAKFLEHIRELQVQIEALHVLNKRSKPAGLLVGPRTAALAVEEAELTGLRNQLVAVVGSHISSEASVKLEMPKQAARTNTSPEKGKKAKGKPSATTTKKDDILPIQDLVSDPLKWPTEKWKGELERSKKESSKLDTRSWRKHVIDTDIVTQRFLNEKPAYHRKYGKVEWTPKQMCLIDPGHTMETERVSTEGLYREFINAPVANASMAYFLETHQSLIPKEWRKGGCVVFLGTLFHYTGPDPRVSEFLVHRLSYDWRGWTCRGYGMNKDWFRSETLTFRVLMFQN